MMALLDRIFGERFEGQPVPIEGDLAYAKAMRMSDNLLDRMGSPGHLIEVTRETTASIWAQAGNVAFLTSVVQTVQEMKSPIEQRPEDQS